MERWGWRAQDDEHEIRRFDQRTFSGHVLPTKAMYQKMDEQRNRSNQVFFLLWLPRSYLVCLKAPALDCVSVQDVFSCTLSLYRFFLRRG